VVDDVAALVAGLNADAQSSKLNRDALHAAIRSHGAVFQEAISSGHDYLFADVPLFVTAAQVEQMRAVIAAVERVVKLPGWMKIAPLHNPLPLAGEEANEQWGKQAIREADARKGNHQSLGVFYGYDFHLNAQGAHLIEINTNAGGGFLNALLIDSQRDVTAPGEVVAINDLERKFLAMFRNEWSLARGDAPLKSVAIVDEQPEAQYLYPEFLLAKELFEQDGIAAYISGPSALQARDDGLYFEGNRIDLVYNRLTDFSLQQYPELLQAGIEGRVVLTPNPAQYARYADKRNLARLSDADGLRTLGASETDIATLQAGVPHTFIVSREMEDALWSERKKLFFKPNSGYGSKGAYRGEKLTRRVFGEILQSDYVAQQMAVAGERMACAEAGEMQSLKYDVRCYVYDGEIQLVAARLYQGQTTNFRTPGGGFAPVRVVG
jgi:hypothetical protein